MLEEIPCTDTILPNMGLECQLFWAVSLDPERAKTRRHFNPDHLFWHS